MRPWPLPPEPEQTTRGPGRPRSARAHESIIRATLERLAERGLEGLTVEAVAARAGVGKATVYRRWATKQELAAAAIETLAVAVPVPPRTGSGTLREQFVALGRERLESARRTRFHRLMPRLLSEAADDPELHALCRRVFVDPARALVAEMLRGAIERGEVRADLDVDVAIDWLVGPLVYRLLITGGELEALDDYPARLFDAMIEGIGV
jgi:AcrR family transcriptional regulator